MANLDNILKNEVKKGGEIYFKLLSYFLKSDLGNKRHFKLDSDRGLAVFKTENGNNFEFSHGNGDLGVKVYVIDENQKEEFDIEGKAEITLKGKYTLNYYDCFDGIDGFEFEGTYDLFKFKTQEYDEEGFYEYLNFIVLVKKN